MRRRLHDHIYRCQPYFPVPDETGSKVFQALTNSSMGAVIIRPAVTASPAVIVAATRHSLQRRPQGPIRSAAKLAARAPVVLSAWVLTGVHK